MYFNKEASAKGLVNILRDQLTTFGIAENLTSVDGSQFRAHVTQEFLDRSGVDYNPHVNIRAESAVKTAKSILMTSTRTDGSRVWDTVSRGLLQHRNRHIGVRIIPSPDFVLEEHKGSAPSEGRRLQTCCDLDYVQRAA